MYNNPFDFSKIFNQNQYDPATMMNEQVQKMFGQFKLPNVDMSAIMEAQQKNLDALSAANKATMEGAQELMKRQAEILQEAMTGATSLAKEMSDTSNTDDLAGKQSKIIEDAMQKALANATELSGIVTKTQEETSKLITERFDANMKELKEAAEAVVK